MEPGRGIVGDAGTLVAEVIGVTWRYGRRWVTVDVGVRLPLTLAEGDRVLFHSAGAYTSTCSTVGFNGFPGLPTVLA